MKGVYLTAIVLTLLLVVALPIVLVVKRLFDDVSGWFNTKFARVLRMLRGE